VKKEPTFGSPYSRAFLSGGILKVTKVVNVPFFSLNSCKLYQRIPVLLKLQNIFCRYEYSKLQCNPVSELIS